MKIYYTGLDTFLPWAGAVYWYDALKRMDAIEQIESDLEESFPEGLSETDVNDFLWFDLDEYMQDVYSLPEGWEKYSNLEEAQKAAQTKAADQDE